MTQHSSLKGASVSTKHRNVLKRHERVRSLQENENWEDRKSIYKLPKLKMIKLKVKKVKEAKESEATAEGASGEEVKPKAEKK
jgi:small basic protein (TIGR04137 family)